MGKSSPASPQQVAQAQSAANVDAIRESAKVNAINQIAPWGSSTYQKDPKTGLPVSQTITLGPAEKQFYDTSNTIKNALAGKAQGFTDYLPTGAFTGPDNGAGDAVAKALYERKLGMVQPELDRAQNQMNVQLMERGIPIGSEIYNDEQNRLSKARGDTLAAISQDATLAAGGEYDRQLANALTLRNQPFNEISAFLQGAPAMPSPQFQQQPAYQVQAPDIAGITNSYNAQMAQQNSALANGLFGLGAAAIPLISDRRFKTDIKRVGETESGLPIHTYRYAWGGPVHMGVMADEVEKATPEAVHTINGIKAVDYARVM